MNYYQRRNVDEWLSRDLLLLIDSWIPRNPTKGQKCESTTNCVTNKIVAEEKKEAPTTMTIAISVVSASSSRWGGKVSFEVFMRITGPIV